MRVLWKFVDDIAEKREHDLSGDEQAWRAAPKTSRLDEQDEGRHRPEGAGDPVADADGEGPAGATASTASAASAPR